MSDKDSKGEDLLKTDLAYWLEKAPKSWDEDYRKIWAEMNRWYFRWFELVKNTRPITPKEEWISVKERLPKKEDDYLCRLIAPESEDVCYDVLRFFPKLGEFGDAEIFKLTDWKEIIPPVSEKK